MVRGCVGPCTPWDSLNSMRCDTRSQWRSCRTSDMWSCFRQREMTLAAAFMTCWRRFRFKSVSPAKMQLQSSIIDNTALLFSILDASVVSERRMVRAFRSALKHAPASLAMWDRSDRSRSIRTSSFVQTLLWRRFRLWTGFYQWDGVSDVCNTTRTLFLLDSVLVGLNTSTPRCWRYTTVCCPDGSRWTSVCHQHRDMATVHDFQYLL